AILKPMSAAPVHPALVKVAAQDAVLPGAALPDRSVGEGTDIIVTGYRHSLTEAQNLKRRAVGNEDDIVATDIAAFPDLN
ncbi:hypothetical protein C1X73_38780, partial [Pseudomonas sp. FW305-130]